MSIGQSDTLGAQGYNVTGGIWMGRDTDEKYKFSLSSPNTSASLKWDGDNLIVCGSINATDGLIGAWVIDDPVLRDINSKIILDPTTPEIGYYTTAGRKKLSIRSGSISDPSTISVLININPSPLSIPATIYNSSNFGGGSPTTKIFLSTTPYFNFFTVPQTATYTIATPNWGTSPLTNPRFRFPVGTGNVNGKLYVDVYDTNDRSGNLIKRLNIGGTGVIFNNTIISISFFSSAQSLVLEAGKIYYPHLTFELSGTVPFGSQFEIINPTNTAIDPASNSAQADLDITELTTDGLVIAKDSNNYTVIRRSDNAFLPKIESKGGVLISGSYGYAGGTKPSSLRIGTIGTGFTSTDKAISIGGLGEFTMDYGLGNVATDSGRFRITNTGQIYAPRIRDISAVAGKLTLRWIPTTGEIGYDNTSTRRNKKDITDWIPPPNLLGRIIDISPKMYRFKSQESNTDKFFGMIAEDFQSAGLSEVVIFGPPNEQSESQKIPAGLDYEKISLILWKGMQELIVKVRQLESIISGSQK